MNDLDIPPADVCQTRCIDFAAITKTDTALAQFYLQDRKWDLNSSVMDYINDNKTENLLYLKVITWNVDGLDEKNLKSRVLGACEIIKKENPVVVFLQEIIPSVEEYINQSLIDYKVIIGKSHSNSVYYLCTLLNKMYWSQDNIDIKFNSFDYSLMDRGYLVIQASLINWGKNITLINSHLESTNEASFSLIRQKQFGDILEDIKLNFSQNILLFGGDLNVRDKEVTNVLEKFVKKHPNQNAEALALLDLWEACGCREECRYTYDAKYNENIPFYRPPSTPNSSASSWSNPAKRIKSVPGPARLRFDRLYLSCPLSFIEQDGPLGALNLLKTTTHKAKVYSENHKNKSLAEESSLNNGVVGSEGAKLIDSDGVLVEPVYFGMVGLEKLKSCQRFPSDHWGLKSIVNIRHG